MPTSMRLIVVLFLLTSTIAAGAPVEMELRLMSSEVLVGEPIVAIVIIRNVSSVPVTVPLAAKLRTIFFALTDEAGTQRSLGWTSASHDSSSGPNYERRVSLPPGGWIAFEGYPLHNLVFNSDILNPGTYSLRVKYKTTTTHKIDWKGELVSNPVSLAVRAPTSPEDIKGASYFGRDQNAKLFDAAPNSRYAQWARFRILRAAFPYTSPERGVREECTHTIRQIDGFLRRWADSMFVPQLRVSQARCLLALGRDDEARAVVRPYLDGKRYPIELQLIRGLGLAPSRERTGALELELRLAKKVFLGSEPILVTAVLRNGGAKPISVPTSFQERAIKLSLTKLPVGVPREMQYEPDRIKSLVDLPEKGPVTLKAGGERAFLFDLQSSFLYDLLYGEYRLSMTYQVLGNASGGGAGPVVAAPVQFAIAGPEGEDLQALRAMFRACGSMGNAMYSGRARNAALNGFADTVYGRWAAFYKIWDAPCDSGTTAKLVKQLGKGERSRLLIMKRARCLFDAGARKEARALLLPYSDAKKFPLMANEAKAFELSGARTGDQP